MIKGLSERVKQLEAQQASTLYFIVDGRRLDAPQAFAYVLDHKGAKISHVNEGNRNNGILPQLLLYLAQNE